jgi:teichuronic acid biosynthesis glycosyltransferase TuaG
MVENLVSVVMPARNASATIYDAISSVLAQTHTKLELLVVDDSSTDTTANIVSKIEQKDPRVRLIKCKIRGGAAKARNTALTEAQGEYVAFLDADDVWHQNKIALQIAQLKIDNADFCCSAYRIESSNRKFIRVQSVKSYPTFERFLRKDVTIGCLTVLVKKNALSGLYFDENLGCAEDFLFFATILNNIERSGGHSTFLPAATATYKIYPGSLSRNKFKQALAHWQIFRDRLRFSHVQSVSLMIHYAKNAIKERVKW